MRKVVGFDPLSLENALYNISTMFLPPHESYKNVGNRFAIYFQEKFNCL